MHQPPVHSDINDPFATIKTLEKENDELRYELKRVQFKLDHAKPGTAGLDQGEYREDEIERFKAALRDLGNGNDLLAWKQMHAEEMHDFQRGSDKKIERLITASARESIRLVERLERLRDAAPDDTDRSSRRSSVASSLPSLSFSRGNSPSLSRHSSFNHPRETQQTISQQLVAQFLTDTCDAVDVRRKPESSSMSFASNFSTETLELDLNEVARDELLENSLAEPIGAPPETQQATKPAMRAAASNGGPSVAVARAAAAAALQKNGRGPPPPVPMRPKRQSSRLNVDSKPSESAKVAVAVTLSQPTFANVDGLPPPKVSMASHKKAAPPPPVPLRAVVQGAFCCLEDENNESATKHKEAPASLTATVDEDKTTQSDDDVSEGEEDDKDGSASEGSADSFKTRRRGRSRTRRVRKAPPSFTPLWAEARMGTLLVKLASARKSEKCSARFCVYVDKRLHIFRSEIDAKKYSMYLARVLAGDCPAVASGSKKLPYRPLRSVFLDQTELRVIRRPSAQNELDGDARSSMMVWLRKRNYNVETADAHAAHSKHGKPIFKLHLVEHDHHALSSLETAASFDCNSSTTSSSGNLGGSGISDLTSEAGSSTSGTSVSTFSTSISHARLKHHVYLALPIEAERTSWVEEFTRTSQAVQVEAGSLWLKSVGRKRDGEWIKRYAVVRPGRLDLHDYESESLRESVSLMSVKVEPAYTAHIFLSHKQHQKQLITLRAYDGTERNWWIAALRSCCPRKGSANAGSHGRNGSGQSQDGPLDRTRSVVREPMGRAPEAA
ncbi:Hypothetical Protein FCC1311_076362 [Hondaea fermentalgiana]|uniref:PH domain-containing protein n=1 Tax=Hondaea fermentalgiana TaxID=2315210 RepID=A0A2R5GKH7_9STRA|nr:Hypothetical Protein FCC1311_076362 [Hondaea fermentalgiana]|eukprot:GBG31412.1 Hypothetical Protein FCC1311_076362 [Hondaea fermentalgiana]